MSRNIIYRVSDGRFDDVVAGITREGAPESSEIIYDGRNRLRAFDTAYGKMNVKEFHTPKFPNSLIYTTLRQGKARRSFENASRLLELGIGTPMPVGYGEVRDGLILTRSYYVCRQLDDVETVRDWTRFDDCENILRGLARFLGRLVAKGVFHKDFTAGNVLFRSDGRGGYEYYLVDLNRMIFNVRDIKTLSRMFRAIAPDDAETVRFARIYAEENGVEAETMVELAMLRRREFLNKKAALGRLKAIFGLKKR